MKDVCGERGQVQRWDRRTHVGHTAREKEDFHISAMEPGVPAGLGDLSLSFPMAPFGRWVENGRWGGGKGKQGAVGRLDMQCV